MADLSDLMKSKEFELRETKLSWNSYEIEYGNFSGILKAFGTPVKVLLVNEGIPPQVAVVWQYTVWFVNTGTKGKINPMQVTPESRLEGLTYETLNEQDRISLGLKTVRCIFITPQTTRDESSMYEIFYRLNIGGVNLTPQEIRTTLYYSDFYNLLTLLNLSHRWRRLTAPEPDIRMRDLEILMRGFAILMEGEDYKPPMVGFLNSFSKKARSFSESQVQYAKKLFETFLLRCEKLPDGAFQLKTGRFSASVYEAIFASSCEKAWKAKNFNVKDIDPLKLEGLKKDSEFLKASRSETTSKENVSIRLRRARELLT